MAKMNKWRNAPTLTMLKANFNNSKEEHDARVGRARQQLDALNTTGKHHIKKREGKSQVMPKVVKRNAEWRYTEISEPFLDEDDLFTCKPVSWEDKPAVAQNQALLNWQFTHQLDKQSIIDISSRKFIDEGTTFARVGWYQETRKVKETVTIWEYVVSSDPEEMQMQQEIIERALQLKSSNPYYYNQIRPDIIAAVDYYEENQEIVIAFATGEIEEEVEQVVKEQPTVDIINQNNLYLDPTANGDIKKAKFVIYLFPASRSELEASGLYSNIDKIDFSHNTILDTNYENADGTNFTFEDEARKQVIVYEYWGFYDVNNDGLLEPIVMAWVGDTLIRSELNPYPDKQIPFCAAKYRPVADQYDGESDAPLIQDNQRTIGAITRGIIDTFARNANGQRGVPNGLLDEVNYEKFANGIDYFYNPNGDPKSQIVQSTFSDIPQSALQVIQWQQSDTESLTGVKSFGNTGISGDSLGQVAAGVHAVTSTAAQRKNGILRRYKRFIIDIGKKIMAMNQEYLSEDKVIRITNEEFVNIPKDDLKGSYDVTLNISSREEDQAKAQTLAFLLQTMGNSLDFNITKRMMQEYATLEHLPEFAHDIGKMQPPQPDPSQQFELQKLQEQVRELQAKVELTRVKARAEASKTNLSDLDYVERGTGVKHDRDMEHQRAQAQANQDLEITKGLMQRNPQQNPNADANIADAIGYNMMSKQLENL